ncbi:MAG: hypothetical protein GC185_07555 [Alphaproteobacteria bacterium]|nr:hypothetical protein [Alphaproteobacteria bacterium]
MDDNAPKDTPEDDGIIARLAGASLIRAALADSLQGVAEAFRNGADVNARDPETGRTALMVAIENKNAPMTQWLLDAGANPALRIPAPVNPPFDTRDTQAGMNAYHVAAASTPEIMDILLHHPDRDREAAAAFFKDGKQTSSALRRALKNADKDMVLALIDYGLDVNEKDDDGETALFYLLQHRSSREEGLPFLRLLIENGADVDKAINYWEETPLLAAARADFEEAVERLLELGADPNRKSHLQDTPLLAACAETWNAHIVTMLLDAGADIHATDRTGRTPLHLAARNNRLDIVKTLLARGANPLAVDKNGQTPDDTCLAPARANMRKLILQKQAKLGFPTEDPGILAGKFNQAAKIRLNRENEKLQKQGRKPPRRTRPKPEPEPAPKPKRPQNPLQNRTSGRLSTRFNRHAPGKPGTRRFRPRGQKPPFKSGWK